MAVTSNWYRKADIAAYNKEIDFADDTIKILLCTSSYTPNLDTHDYHSDLTNEVANGNGYTTGGATLASKTMTYTAANSWSPTWAAATAYGAEAIVRPTSGNGYLYRAQGAGGTSHATTEPTWPTTIGDEVTDNGVVWTCIGKGILAFDAADPSWSASTITARYAVIYDDSPATSATKPLLVLIDFGADVSSTSATFQIVFASLGFAYKAIF